ncbi:MAG: YchF/TatD family DNA exonuclease [bacterium]
MFIDSHCHLSFPQYNADRTELIARLKKEGIDYAVDIGTEAGNWANVLVLSQQYDFIYAALGVHPHEAEKINIQTWERLKTLSKDKKVIAIGETGLDFYRNLSPKETQIEVFRRHIRIAKEVKKPLIIHIRDAYDDAIAIIKEENAHECGGVIHCFSGSYESAKLLMDAGFFISFAGQITFPKNTYPELIKKISIEKILIETDAPYLAPVPKRGQRNEPSFIRYTAEKIAEIKGLSLEDVARITSLNTKKIFAIESINHSIPTEGKITYPIRNSLYLNITNRCTNKCDFCVRYKTNFVKGHNLRLQKEPELEDILDNIGDTGKYNEVVFCGFGEPLIRLALVKQICKNLKTRNVSVRIDTNGHGNLIHKRNILPELKGLVDSMSISLNAENEEKYFKICRPSFGKETYGKVIEFIKEAKKYIPEVNVSVVALPEIDIEKCKSIARELGVGFRFRKYDEVG